MKAKTMSRTKAARNAPAKSAKGGSRAVGPASGRQAVGPASGRQAVGPASGRQAAGPASGRRAAAPAGGVTPYLIVKDAAAAIAFYTKILGAKEQYRLTDPSGKVGHAELAIRNGQIFLADEFPSFGALAPPTVGGSPVGLHVYVADVDAVMERARAAGADFAAGGRPVLRRPGRYDRGSLRPSVVPGHATKDGEPARNAEAVRGHVHGNRGACFAHGPENPRSQTAGAQLSRRPVPDGSAFDGE